MKLTLHPLEHRPAYKVCDALACLELETSILFGDEGPECFLCDKCGETAVRTQTVPEWKPLDD